MTSEDNTLLEIEDVSVSLPTPHGSVKAVDKTSFQIQKNETFVLIGESGSGKSILGLAIMRLLPKSAEFSGKIKLCGKNLVTLSEKEMRKIRGKTIASIAQNPYLSMNPSLHVGAQIAEPMRIHLRLPKIAAKEKVHSLLNYFDIKPANIRAKEHPYRYSGGMLQRAMIAMGVAANPELIIADEPTKGIDVIKKQNIASLFHKISEDGCSFLIITHDIGFAQEMADRIAVNYCGQIIEIAEKNEFFNKPLHPYSEALVNSLPENGFEPIQGQSPSMIDYPKGCRFHPRCKYADDKCRTNPPMAETNNRFVRCWLYV